MIIIVDTNIIFSALRSKNSKLRSILLNPEYTFYAPNFIIVEIFKHKEKILKKSKASEAEIIEFMNKILRRINFINEEILKPESKEKSFELCRNIDESDAPFVALTLDIQGKFWTGDKKLIRALKRKGFNDFFPHD
jgi:predicted nucleic acid-binding protein